MIKTTLALLVSLASVLLVACGGSSPSYEGQWTVDKQSMKTEVETALREQLKGIAEDLVEQQILTARQMIDQTSTSLRLNKGGTFSMVATMGNHAQTSNGTWTQDGNEIVLSAQGRPDVKARIKDGKLLVENVTGQGPKHTVMLRGGG